MPLDLDRVVDYIAPSYIEEERLSVTLEVPSETVFPNAPITVLFSYDDADAEGVMLPLELVVQPTFGDGGPAYGYFVKVFRRSVPNQYTFTVPSAGRYLVVLRERFHNRFFGRLLIDVAGDSFSQVRLTRF